MVALVAMAACTSPGKRTGIGAGAGAATGAAIGGAAGGWKGAGIGALAGAATGAAVGNYLDKQYNEIEKVADAKRVKDGILVNLKNDLLFETGKAELRPEAIQQLQELGGILAKYKRDRIRIAGFTDSVGGAELNKSLSERRAKSVHDILSVEGVAEDQMRIEGYGEARPVASNDSKQGRSKNRRVELYIDVPEERAPASAVDEQNLESESNIKSGSGATNRGDRFLGTPN